MKVLLIIVIVIVAIIVLLLIIGLFSKKAYHVERVITINKPRQVVFDYIKMERNHAAFNKWWMTDPNVRMHFTGIDGTVGFIAAWESDDKQVGKGEQETKRIDEGQQVDYEIRFIKPFEGKAAAYIKTIAADNAATTVHWGFGCGMKYPMNIMLLFINIPKMLGNDLAISLGNLKTKLEQV